MNIRPPPRRLASFGAPAEAAPVMARLQIDTQAAVRDLAHNPQLDEVGRARALAALQQNARERLASTLTPEQLERYERALGLWIPRLTTPPPLPRN
ncbi:MAG: hypothetical protein J6386_26155 [Candidatus Synoicihabitans palmerolidicus]|nr:hypothetical protein [Candidatus Synoicihabitans palmerolidicus]MCC5023873.1 hypothetical protein [Candidatus Synoicihabitans palmerolidicus]MCC5025211.1 hypothetical protein [Candidatus Synoicihabitans palmerolidicus]MCC5025909.1 hypothetical protein [Candidatus Synoicihabitans palmerolidicus]MCC5025944.1 hypothetical protein [Candidatus Synoicihabitans palmerolidicus]